MGGDGVGGNATWRFDVTTRSWTQMPDLPSAYRAPALAVFGGYLILSGGAGSMGMSSQLLALSTTNWTTSSPWNVINVANGPSPRNGHRVVVFGGRMFLFGGWDQTQYYNDLYVLDLTSTMSYGSGSWIQMVNNGVAGMPPPRNSFALETSSSRIVIFGGFYHNVAGSGPWTDCSGPNDNCIWYNDVWVYHPGGMPAGGLIQPSAAAMATNPGWTQMSTNGPTPPGRFWAATGIISDQLFVYGGQAQGGALSDLWVLNFVTNSWAQVTQSGALPGQLGSPAGACMSHTLWVYNAFSPTTGQLWVMEPTGSTNSNSGNTISISTAGLGAGVALAVLISAATLVFTILMWRAGRAAAAAQVGAVGEVYDRL